MHPFNFKILPAIDENTILVFLHTFLSGLFFKLEKILTMKQLLLLLTACVSLTTTQAQEDQLDAPKVDAEALLRRYRQEQVNKLPTDSVYTYKHLLIPGNGKPGVYSLPQDNMPCIVPDSTKTVRIPNAWKGLAKPPYRSKPPRMPNLSTRPEFLKHNSAGTADQTSR